MCCVTKTAKENHLLYFLDKHLLNFDNLGRVVLLGSTNVEEEGFKFIAPLNAHVVRTCKASVELPLFGMNE